GGGARGLASNGAARGGDEARLIARFLERSPKIVVGLLVGRLDGERLPEDRDRLRGAPLFQEDIPIAVLRNRALGGAGGGVGPQGFSAAPDPALAPGEGTEAGDHERAGDEERLTD